MQYGNFTPGSGFLAGLENAFDGYQDQQDRKRRIAQENAKRRKLNMQTEILEMQKAEAAYQQAIAQGKLNDYRENEELKKMVRSYPPPEGTAQVAPGVLEVQLEWGSGFVFDKNPTMDFSFKASRIIKEASGGDPEEARRIAGLFNNALSGDPKSIADLRALNNQSISNFLGYDAEREAAKQEQERQRELDEKQWEIEQNKAKSNDMDPYDPTGPQSYVDQRRGGGLPRKFGDNGDGGQGGSGDGGTEGEGGQGTETKEEGKSFLGALGNDIARLFESKEKPAVKKFKGKNANDLADGIGLKNKDFFKKGKSGKSTFRVKADYSLKRLGVPKESWAGLRKQAEKILMNKGKSTYSNKEVRDALLNAIEGVGEKKPISRQRPVGNSLNLDVMQPKTGSQTRHYK